MHFFHVTGLQKAPLKDQLEEFEGLSFTYPLINNAKNVLFLALGENKASIIKKILIDKVQKLVSSHIKAKENLYFILDKISKI